MATEELKEYIANIVSNLPTHESLGKSFESFKKEILTKFEEIVNAQNKKIEELESTIAVQNNVIEKLKIDTDMNQQYSRRSSLRIHGVQVPERDGKEDINSVIKECYSKLDIPFSNDNIDRAHRIGKSYVDKFTGIKVKSIIVKLSQFPFKCYS